MQMAGMIWLVYRMLSMNVQTSQSVCLSRPVSPHVGKLCGFPHNTLVIITQHYLHVFIFICKASLLHSFSKLKGAAIAQWQAAGLQVKKLSDQLCTWHDSYPNSSH